MNAADAFSFAMLMLLIPSTDVFLSRVVPVMAVARSADPTPTATTKENKRCRRSDKAGRIKQPKAVVDQNHAAEDRDQKSERENYFEK